MKRSIIEAFSFVVTIVVAAAVGFGIPAGWVWIGSQVQGGSGASNLDWSVAMLILFGIIASYVAVLYVAGWLIARLEGDIVSGPQRGSAREPWMRGMTDSRAISPRHTSHLDRIERTFVITTIIVTAAVSVWFFLFAGSPLPNQ